MFIYVVVDIPMYMIFVRVCVVLLFTTKNYRTRANLPLSSKFNYIFVELINDKHFLQIVDCQHNYTDHNTNRIYFNIELTLK